MTARGVLGAIRWPGDPRVRLAALATFVNFVGTGLFFAAGTIFLVRSAGLRPSEVGIGLTVGGLAGMGAGVLLGDRADRRGAGGVVMACMVLEGMATVALLAVHGPWSLAAVSAVASVGRAGSTSGWRALIGVLAEQGQATRLRAYLRAVNNAGLAVGMLGAGVVLAVDTRAGYVAMLLVDAGTFLVGAALIGRLPRMAPTRGADASADGAAADAGPRWLALRDARYLALTAAVSVASLQYFVLTEALPLWVSQHTSAPRWFVAIALLVAALLVTAIQVPATRSIDGPRSAARLVALSGPVFLAAWVLMAGAAKASAALAVVVLLVAVVVHSLAEVWQAGGAFELSFALAEPEAQGQYQGVFGLGMSVAEAVAPALVLSLCVTWGMPGWIVLGAVVSLAGLACAAIERRGGRTAVAPTRG